MHKEAQTMHSGTQMIQQLLGRILLELEKEVFLDRRSKDHTGGG